MNEPTASQQFSKIDSELLAAFEELHQRLSRGEEVSIEDYVGRLPQHAAALREMFGTMQVMGQLCLDHSQDEFVSADTPQTKNQVATALPGASRPLSFRQLGEFTIVRQVGRGGMGIVYEAYQGTLQRRVALKILPLAGLADRRHIIRFKNEARAAATLHHTNIVPIHSVGTDQGVHYYAMQFIDGPSFAEIIRELNSGSGESFSRDVPTESHPIQVTFDESAATQESPAASNTHRVIEAGISTARDASPSEYFRTVAKWIEQAADGLAHAHENGVLHRDIKPGNLMVDETGHVWITDFGLARLEADASLTATGEMLGTLRYMAPEQVSGNKALVDYRADIYSLGLTMYELLTLKPAFAGNDRPALLKKIASAEPRAPRQLDQRVPKDLETIVLKATEKNPSDRYLSAQEFSRDLARFLDNRPILAKRPSMAACVAKWSFRHRTLVGSVAVALLVLCLTSSLVFWNANHRIQSAMNSLQDKNIELLQAHAQSQKSLTLARGAIDKVYVEYANNWVGQQSNLSSIQRDFLVSAAEIYTNLIGEYPHDYDLLLRTIEAQVGAANISAQLGLPEEANAWFQKAFGLIETVKLDYRLDEGRFLSVIAKAKVDYGWSNFSLWRAIHTKQSDKEWTYDEVLPAVEALADYVARSPHDIRARLTLIDAQGWLLSHIFKEDELRHGLNEQLLRNIDQLSVEESSPEALSQLSNALGQSIQFDLDQVLDDQGYEPLAKKAQRAIDLSERAFQISSTHENQRALSLAISTLGNIQGKFDRLPEAVESYGKSLEHAVALVQNYPNRNENWRLICGQYGVTIGAFVGMSDNQRLDWQEYYQTHCEEFLLEALALDFPEEGESQAYESIFRSNIYTYLGGHYAKRAQVKDVPKAFECIEEAQRYRTRADERAKTMAVRYVDRLDRIQESLAKDASIPFTFEQRSKMIANWMAHIHGPTNADDGLSVYRFDADATAAAEARVKLLGWMEEVLKKRERQLFVRFCFIPVIIDPETQTLIDAAALAEEIIREGSVKGADRFNLEWLRAWTNYKLGNYKQALDWYLEYENMKDSPHSVLRFQLSLVLFKLGRASDSRKYFETGLSQIEANVLVDRFDAKMTLEAASLFNQQSQARALLKERWVGDMAEFEASELSQ